MNIKNDEIKKILISRTDKIGDIILTLPLISECRRTFRNAEITFLTNSVIKNLLEGYEDIDKFIYYDELQSFYEKYKIIKKGKYDIAISVFPRFESALLFFISGIKLRVGTAYRGYSFFYNKRVREHRKIAEKHESQYNINLLKYISEDVRDEFIFKLKYSTKEKNLLKNKLDEFNVNIDGNFIIIHPGSKGSATDISAETLGKFVKQFTATYKDFKIILTGTKVEYGLSKKISDLAFNQENIIILNNKLNLRELMILIDSSKLFISNSTGPIHIAGALNKNIIGFYPSKKPMTVSRWGPLSSNSIVLSPKNDDTDMNEINPEDIMDAVNKLINN
ncbi:MAG: glycosyltransferase family 9 protein [Ignavibacteria bacterium]|nr:glycosyltransferase family 9 protein [Ignavibacteria bacterium]